MKYFLKLLLIITLFISTSSYAQLDTACNSIMGQVQMNSCTTYPFDPPVLSGQTVEKCFTFQPNEPNINLSYIILNNTCGPVAPYNYLNFRLFDCTCYAEFVNGQIVPQHVNTFITGLDTTRCYILCVTWTALCDQFSICPLIYDSGLPVKLTEFSGHVYEHNILNLNWMTESEVNSDYFIIYRSKNLEHLEECLRVQAAGNSTSTLRYQYQVKYDLDYPYYTIAEVDYDGTKNTYSTIYVKPEITDFHQIEYFDIMGIKHQVLVPGIYFVKQGNSVQKVVKIN